MPPRALLRQLRKIETHTTAPRYKTAGAEACYKWYKGKAGVMIGAQAIKVAVYGIENMEEFMNAGKIYIPIQIHLGKSKREYADRPRKAAAYLYTSVMLEGPQYMERALLLLLDHVYCTRLHAGDGCKINPLGDQSYGHWLRQPLP